MATRQRNLATVDEDVTHAAARFEYVAIRNHEVGDFADFECWIVLVKLGSVDIVSGAR